jgi:hypothetical protein
MDEVNIECDEINKDIFQAQPTLALFTEFFGPVNNRTMAL